ncbi:MAG: alpha/beta hydrolase [Pseudomonadota bacterium]
MSLRNLSFSPSHFAASRAILSAIVLITCASHLAPAHAQEPEPTRQIILTPDILISGGVEIVGERGLILVPENRSQPESRMIAVHFQRYPAIEKTDGRAPVFLLPGGPGGEYEFDTPVTIAALNRLRKTRDVIAISQRGNPGVPGLVPDLSIRNAAIAPLDQPASMIKASKRSADAYQVALERWTAAGVDVGGYDIINIVDDIYDVRKALGYGKIVLRGCSFGSQWSFSYMKRWPDTVDRALLSGVEPLDFAYDSAKWLWVSMARLAAQAEADPDLAPAIPEGGLLAAYKTVLKRLRTEPATVSVADPSSGGTIDVTVGPDDLRLGAIRYFDVLGGETDTDGLALWPHFILELYNGDYRALGLMTAVARTTPSDGPMITALIDNSLGISDKRDDQLLAEVERQWVEPNWWYRATRNVDAALEVDASFRDDEMLPMPVLLVSGSFDWSTPIENAQHAEAFLEQGKLVTIGGATHCPLYQTEQVLAQNPELVETLYTFIDRDFEDADEATEYFASLPDSYDLSVIDFAPRDDISIYQKMIESALKP